MDLQSVCYCLISLAVKRFRCAAWHWRWIRVELALEWLNCTTLSSLQRLGREKKPPSCSWAVPLKLTAPCYLTRLHVHVFSKRDSWIAVVSAPSVRWSLFGTAFYSAAGSQCCLAWQITLKRFPPTTPVPRICAFLHSLGCIWQDIKRCLCLLTSKSADPLLLLLGSDTKRPQWEFGSRWF